MAAARDAIDAPSALPLYRRLAEALASHLAGESEDVLPSARALAHRIGVNRATVTAAYRELARRGLTELRPGRPRRRPSPGEDVFGETEADEPPPGAIDLARYAPNQELLPGGAVFRWLGFGEGEGEGVAQYGSVWGYQPLRNWLAVRLAGFGIPVRADKLLLTAGVQHALDLLLRALIQPGDEVLVEDPTYPGLPPLLAAHRVRPVPVPIHPGGLDPGELAQVLNSATPRLAILTPTLHNPSGTVMAENQRREVLRLLTAAGVLIVEEFFDPELVADGPSPPPLAAAAPGVVVVGSFSKALFPGLRVGWVVGPESITRRMAEVKRATDLSGSPFLEAAAWNLCHRGVLEDQFKRLRRASLQRREVVVQALSSFSKPAIRWSRPRGGFSMLVFLPSGRSSRSVAARAAASGTWVLPGPPMSVSGRDDVLRVAYAAHGGPALRRGMQHVTAALRGVGGDLPLV